jgi:hypothetical protein
MYAKLEINDLFDELREENKRLLTQLLFAQKCIKLLESYRNCFNSFQINNKCNQNILNKSLLNDLENQYKSLFSHQNMTQLLGINQTLSKS